jgi:hypothetical protein
MQFIVGTIISIFGGGVSIIAGCHGSGNVDCVSNAFVSLLVALFFISALGVLLAIGYVAQEKRNARLAYVLIGAEAFAGIIFLFDARHAAGWFDRLCNLVLLMVALWVGYLAWQQAQAGGRRIVHRHNSTK